MYLTEFKISLNFPVLLYAVNDKSLSLIFFGKLFHRSVSKKPNDIILQVKLMFLFSQIRDCIKPTNACFDPEYKEIPASPYSARDELKNIILTFLLVANAINFEQK